VNDSHFLIVGWPRRDVLFGSLADIRVEISDVRLQRRKRTCSASASMSA